MITNFFSAGEWIVARLQDQVSVPRLNIRLAPNQEWAIANVVDQAIHVIFFDDQPDANKNNVSARGNIQLSNQYWLVVVSQKNVANVGLSARQDMGDLIVSVLSALQGFEPSEDHVALKRERSPFRNPDKGSYVHVPLLFSTKIII